MKCYEKQRDDRRFRGGGGLVGQGNGRRQENGLLNCQAAMMFVMKRTKFKFDTTTGHEGPDGQ